ncbi:hypothetical protein KKE48_00280 [Patescibacteria group bacterium]|nr:hypothetical protein [Patescibacteria group bacterium]
MFSIILGGIIGGALRGIMGIAKSLILKKEEQINYGWFCEYKYAEFTLSEVEGPDQTCSNPWSS